MRRTRRSMKPGSVRHRRLHIESLEQRTLLSASASTTLSGASATTQLGSGSLAYGQLQSGTLRLDSGSAVIGPVAVSGGTVTFDTGASANVHFVTGGTLTLTGGSLIDTQTQAGTFSGTINVSGGTWGSVLAQSGTSTSVGGTIGIHPLPMPGYHAPSGTSSVVDASPESPYRLAVADFGFTDPDDSPSDYFKAVKITTLPSSGRLELSGSPVAAGQFIDVSNVAAGNLTFNPVSGATATAHPRLTFQVQDSGNDWGFFATNLDPVPKTLVFRLAPNVAPVTHDDTCSVREGEVLDHIAMPGSINVLANDTDADGDPLTVILVAGSPHGTLRLNGDGTFRYQPNPGFNGTDSFQYKANDGIDNSATATVTINVTPFGHAPAGTSTTINVPVGPSYAIQVADFGFTDPNDWPADTFTAVKISSLPTSASLLLNGEAVTAGQFISVADIAAGNLTLSPANGSPHASFTFQVEDDTAAAEGSENLDPNPKTLTFNTPPVAQDDFYSVDENQMLDQAFLGNHLRLTTTYANGTRWPNPLSIDVDGSEGQCTASAADGSLTFTYSGSYGLYLGTHVVKLAGPGNAPLMPGVYTDAKGIADATSPGLSIDDPAGVSTDLVGQFTVIEAVYGASGEIERFDATFEQHNPTSSYYSYSCCGRIQYHASKIVGTGMLANDSDADGDPLSLIPLATPVFVINNPIGVGNGGIVVFHGGTPVALVTPPQHGTLVFYSDGGFVYYPAPNYYGTDNFQYRTNDGTAESNLATVTIQVNHVSQAPMGTSSTLNIPARAYALSAADFGFCDWNDGPADSLARVKITTLPSSGSLTLAGDSLTAGQFVSVAELDAGALVFTPVTDTPRTTRASFSFQVEDSGSTDRGGVILDPTPETLTLNCLPTARADSYTVDENELLSQKAIQGHLWLTGEPGSYIFGSRSCEYDNSTGTFSVEGNDQCVRIGFSSQTDWCYVVFTAPTNSRLVPGVYNGATQYSCQSSDSPGLEVFGDGRSFSQATGQFTITEAVYGASGEILRFDATFELQSDNNPALLTGRVQYEATPNDWSGVLQNDVDADGDPIAAFLVSGPQHGTLSLDRDGGFGYRPDADFYGIDTFQYVASEGWVQSDPATVTITVNKVSQAPAGTSSTLSFAADATYTVTEADFGFTDPHDHPSDTFTRVKITTLPTAGSLTFAGLPVTAGQFIDVGDLTAGKLVYTPVVLASDTSRASLTFQVEDSGSTDRDGVVLDPTPRTLTFNCIPVAADDAFTAVENRTLNSSSLTGILENDADGDGDPLTTILVSEPEHGVLTLDPSGSFVYTPSLDFFGADSFQYKVNDGTADSNVATVSITVDYASQPPSGTPKEVTLSPGAAYVVQEADFGFTDPHDHPADNFTRVRITTLPARGSLLLAGMPVVAGQFVSVDDLAAGKLVLNMPSSGVHPLITFQVEDSGSTARDGVVLDPTPETLQFNFAPIASNDTYTTSENTVLDQSQFVTRLRMTSRPGDLVGGGRNYDFRTTDGQFSAWQDYRNGVTIGFHGVGSSSNEDWFLEFDGWGNSPLAPGSYLSWHMGGTSGNGPELYLSRSSSSEGDGPRTFTILEVSYGPAGEVLQFDATFEVFPAAAATVAGVAPILSGWIQYFATSTATSSVLSNDTDSDGDPLSAILVAGPQHGTLELADTGNFVYTPEPYYVGADSFQYKTTDGKSESNVATVTLDVTRASQAPSGTSSTVNVPSSVPYVLKVADFGFTDPHDSPADRFTRVWIQAGPTRGTLTLSGTPIVESTLVTTADIQAGKLVYNPPPPTANPWAGHGSITFQVEDSGNPTGGVTLDPQSKCLTFNVVPVAQDRTYATAANTPLDASRFKAHLVLDGTTVSGEPPSYDFNQNNASFLVAQGPGSEFWSAPLTVDCQSGSDRWILAFGPNGGGGPLWPGLFQGAVGYKSSWYPYLLVHDGVHIPSTSSQVYGWFGVNGIVYGPSWEVLGVDISFQEVRDYYGLVSGRILFDRQSLLNNGQDAECDRLTTILVSDPQHGTVYLNADGTFTYTPAAGFIGTDSFQYKVNDGAADSNVATATLRVGTPSQAPMGTSGTVNVAGRTSYVLKPGDFGFRDPGDETADCFRWVGITTLPSSGQLTLGGAPVSAGQFVAVADLVAGNLVFTPAAASAANRHSSFTFQVADSGSTDIGGMNLDPVPKTLAFNAFPVAVSDAYTITRTAPLNVPAATGVLKNDADVDGDSLTAVLVTAPRHGRVTLNPDGSFLYTPDAYVSGADSFQYRLSDGAGDSNLATVSIAINAASQAPSGTSGVLRMQAAAPYVLKVSDFGFTDAGDFSPDAFTRVKIVKLPPADSLTMAGKPVAAGQYVTIANIQAGRLVFTPPARAAAGVHAAFTFQVEDNGSTAGGGAILDPSPETLRFDIAPVATADVYSTYQNKALAVSPALGVLRNDTDLDRDPLTAILVAGPQHGVLKLDAKGGFVYTPAAGFHGTDTFRYKINDGLLNSNVATVSIRVQPVIPPPSGTSKIITIAAKTPYAVKLADFGFKSPPTAASPSGFAFKAVKLARLPSAGRLSLAGKPVVVGQVIPAASIAGGLLTFTPAANATSSPYASLTFQVQDAGGTANGRSDMDPLPKTMTFKIPSAKPSLGNGTKAVKVNSGKPSRGPQADWVDAVLALYGTS